MHITYQTNKPALHYITPHHHIDNHTIPHEPGVFMMLLFILLEFPASAYEGYIKINKLVKDSYIHTRSRLIIIYTIPLLMNSVSIHSNTSEKGEGRLRTDFNPMTDYFKAVIRKEVKTCLCKAE